MVNGQDAHVQLRDPLRPHYYGVMNLEKYDETVEVFVIEITGIIPKSICC